MYKLKYQWVFYPSFFSERKENKFGWDPQSLSIVIREFLLIRVLLYLAVSLIVVRWINVLCSVRSDCGQLKHFQDTRYFFSVLDSYTCMLSSFSRKILAWFQDSVRWVLELFSLHLLFAVIESEFAVFPVCWFARS